MSFTKEEAKVAGTKSKRGKGKKTLEWEQLGDFLTEAGAKRAMKHLMTLDDEEFFRQYEKLLNYFKPKMSAATIDATVQGEVSISPKEWVDSDEDQ